MAVILSNQGGDPELHQRAIVTMGDTLGKQALAPSSSSPLGWSQAQHTCARVLGFCVGPKCIPQLAFDPRASVFWGQKLRGKECPSGFSVSQKFCSYRRLLSAGDLLSLVRLP